MTGVQTCALPISISSAFQSTFRGADSLRLPAGFLLRIFTPDFSDCGFGPVPIHKEKTLRRGQIRTKFPRTAKPMPGIGGKPEPRSPTGREHQSSNGLSLPNPPSLWQTCQVALVSGARDAPVRDRRSLTKNFAEAKRCIVRFHWVKNLRGKTLLRGGLTARFLAPWTLPNGTAHRSAGRSADS